MAKYSLLCAALFSSLASAESLVVDLTKETFSQTVLSFPYDHSWFIRFYAPWSNDSKEMNATWEQFGLENAEFVNVGDVNCTLEWELCKKYRVAEYPSLFYFEQLDASLNDFYEYHGPKSVKAFRHYTVERGFEHDHDFDEHHNEL